MLYLGLAVGSTSILWAKRVGPTGTAYGLDMTDEMLGVRPAERPRDAEVANVHFLDEGVHRAGSRYPAESVDVVISNCVINLATDKVGGVVNVTQIGRVL